MVDNLKNKEQLSFFINELIKGEVDENMAELMKEFLVQKRIHIKKEIEKNQRELNEIENVLELYEKIFETKQFWKSIVSEPQSDYLISPDGPVDFRSKEYWRKLSLQVLKKSEAFIPSSDIMNASIITDKEVKRQCMSTLSIVLAEMYTKGLIRRIKVEGERGYYYAMPGTLPIIKDLNQ